MLGNISDAATIAATLARNSPAPGRTWYYLCSYIPIVGEPPETVSISTQTDNSILYSTSVRQKLEDTRFTSITTWKNAALCYREVFGIPNKMLFTEDWSVDFLAYRNLEHYAILTLYIPPEMDKSEITPEDVQVFLDTCSQFRVDIYPLIVSNRPASTELQEMEVADYFEFEQQNSTSRGRPEILREYSRRTGSLPDTRLHPNSNNVSTLHRKSEYTEPIGHMQMRQRRLKRGPLASLIPDSKRQQHDVGGQAEVETALRGLLIQKESGILTQEEQDDVESIRWLDWKMIELPGEDLDQTYDIIAR